MNRYSLSFRRLFKSRKPHQTRLQSPWQILMGAGQSVQATLGLHEKWLMALGKINIRNDTFTTVGPGIPRIYVPASPAIWHHLIVALPVIFHTASDPVSMKGGTGTSWGHRVTEGSLIDI
jgi:hypothetical protein